jgi:organic radical activating enzyme
MKTLEIAITTYPIVETFHSVQGEGFWTGVSAFFIRLGGCDVYCPWCDQKESWKAKPYPQRSIIDITREAKNANPAIVIITGGEPLMHALNPLTKSLKAWGMPVHLETSGSHPFTGEFDWVTFSPKAFKLPHESIYPQVNELKVVIANPKDLQWAEQEAQKVPPSTVKYLQPEWNTPSSQQLVFNYVLQHPHWRISLQAHKFLGIH